MAQHAQTGERARFGQSVGRGEKPVTVGQTHFFDYPWRFAAENEHYQSNRMVQALANGAEPHYYFLGTFQQDDEKPVKAIRDLFAFHSKHQALYTGLKSAARIGLYQSIATERYGQRRAPAGVPSQPIAPHAWRLPGVAGIRPGVRPGQRPAHKAVRISPRY